MGIFFLKWSSFHFNSILSGKDIGELKAELVSAVKEEVAKVRGLTPLPFEGDVPITTYKKLI